MLYEPQGMTQPAIGVLKTRAGTGYLPGMSQPFLLVELVILQFRVKREALMLLDRIFREALTEYESPQSPDQIDAHPLVPVMCGTVAVLRSGGIPVFSEGLIVGPGAAEGAIRVALPAIGQGHSATGLALNWVIRVMNQVVEGHSVTALLAELAEVTKTIRRRALQGMNSPVFLQAAQDAGIPWSCVENNVIQFGWGARARWLDSSFTDVTPCISARLVRNKQAAAHILKMAGIPVPAHALAADAEEAVKLAKQLGYPVVVKPADKDGGRGVSVGLKSAEAVRKAFVKAGALSRAVLVEKHFEGNDYRLQVFQGEVFWVSHRVPGGVTGDGIGTVIDLLAATNADPRRGDPDSNSHLKRIALDEEALELLLEQGLTPDAVPAGGRFVRLRGAANAASGGIPVPALEGAHPDNLALAVRAVRVLRLDLAGVDLLIPDIRRSWLETGAVICEVNAQPQLAPHLPAYLLQRLVKGQGRIPVVMVLGDVADEAWCEQLVTALSSGRCVGVATQAGVKIGQQTVIQEPCGNLRGGMALISDPQVEVAIISVVNDHMLITGLPVDRFDVLVLAGPPDMGDGPEVWERWQGFAQILQEMCSGPIIINQDCAEWVAASCHLSGHGIKAYPTDALAGIVRQKLSEIEP